MAKDMRVTQSDLIAAADAAIREAQQALVNLKGKLATVPGAPDPGPAFDAQTAARDVLAAARSIDDAIRPLIIEAQHAQALAEESAVAS